MKLVKATQQDFQKITRFYRDVIAHTKDMNTCARWVYGKHPTDEMIQNYIREGAMYCCEKDGSVLSAVAFTQQGEDYHGAAWSVSLEDDEVAVVHLLCVAPEWQGKGSPYDHAADYGDEPGNGEKGGAAGCSGLQHPRTSAL